MLKTGSLTLKSMPGAPRLASDRPSRGNASRLRPHSRRQAALLRPYNLLIDRCRLGVGMPHPALGDGGGNVRLSGSYAKPMSEPLWHGVRSSNACFIQDDFDTPPAGLPTPGEKAAIGAGGYRKKLRKQEVRQRNGAIGQASTFQGPENDASSIWIDACSDEFEGFADPTSGVAQQQAKRCGLPVTTPRRVLEPTAFGLGQVFPLALDIKERKLTNMFCTHGPSGARQPFGLDCCNPSPPGREFSLTFGKPQRDPCSEHHKRELRIRDHRATK